MKVNKEKLCYTAPKMETTSFRTEQGYATSGNRGPVGAGLDNITKTDGSW